MEKYYSKEIEQLFEAIISINDIKTCKSFFDDVCTIKEIQDMSQRLEVARELRCGKNYQEISKATGASTATISRVNKCLLYGSGGYNKVLGKEETK